MAVKDWSFPRLLVTVTLVSASTLALALATVGAYVAARANDTLVAYWSENPRLLAAVCLVLVASAGSLHVLVALWVVARLRRWVASRRGLRGERHGAVGLTRGPGGPGAPPGVDFSLEVRAGPTGRRLRWWEIAGLVAAVGAGVWARAHRRSISLEELGVAAAIIVVGVAVARPWRATGRRAR